MIGDRPISPVLASILALDRGCSDAGTGLWGDRVAPPGPESVPEGLASVANSAAVRGEWCQKEECDQSDQDDDGYSNNPAEHHLTLPRPFLRG